MGGTPDDTRRQLSNLRMFLTVFTLVQIVMVGVVVFSINKMNLALVPGSAAPYVVVGLAVLTGGLVAVSLPAVIAAVRARKATEPDAFARFTSEVLIRAFLLNLPGVVLVMGYVLTAKEWLLVPAAIGLVVVWLTRPGRAAFERWRAGQPTPTV